MMSFLNPTPQILIGALLCVTVAVRAWIRHRSTVIRERAITDRLHAAIADTDPLLRPEILRACKDMEAENHGPTPDDEPATIPLGKGPAG